jgi:hypothetical protein
MFPLQTINFKTQNGQQQIKLGFYFVHACTCKAAQATLVQDKEFALAKMQ